jgi:hypothetical protein
MPNKLYSSYTKTTSPLRSDELLVQRGLTPYLRLDLDTLLSLLTGSEVVALIDSELGSTAWRGGDSVTYVSSDYVAPAYVL